MPQSRANSVQVNPIAAPRLPSVHQTTEERLLELSLSIPAVG